MCALDAFSQSNLTAISLSASIEGSVEDAVCIKKWR